MNKSIIGVILLSLALIVGACPEKGSIEEKKEGIANSSESIIRIVFNLPGDDIGSPEHRAILNSIINAIKNREAGEIINSGFGMGSMEVTVKPTWDGSLKEILKIITDSYPGADYSISKPLPTAL